MPIENAIEQPTYQCVRSKQMMTTEPVWETGEQLLNVFEKGWFVCYYDVSHAPDASLLF